MGSEFLLHYLSNSNKRLIHQLEPLIRAGKWAALTSVIDSLDRELRSEPILAILRAQANLRLGFAHKAVGIVNEQLARGKRLSYRIRAAAILTRSAASRFRGFHEEALEDAKTALLIVQSAGPDTELLIEAHKQLGTSFGTLGQFDEAIDNLQTALGLCAQSSDLELLAEVHHYLGIALGHLGRLPDAQVHLQNARALYEKQVNHTELSLVLNNIGQSYFELGQFDLARESLLEAIDYARKSDYSRTEALALIGVGDTLNRMGRYEEALSYFKSSTDHANRALEPRLYCYTNIGMGRSYCEMGEYGKSELFLNKALYESRQSGLKFELGLALLNKGVLERKKGNLQEAEGHLTQCIEMFVEMGAHRTLIRSYLEISQVYLDARTWPLLEKTLKTLGILVVDMEVGDILTIEARDLPEVIAYAASKGIGSPLFENAQAASSGKLHYPTPSGLETRFPGSAQQLHPKVDAYSLGEAEVYLDGKKVERAQWESRKAKELLYYLLSVKQGKTKEELLEVLWPEVSVSLSRNTFYNNVYRVRRALYKECLTQKDGRYQLNLQGVFWFDLDEFHSLIEEAESSPKGSHKRAKLLSDAIRIYRGSFLKDFYAEWSDSISLETEAQYLSCLVKLAGYYASKSQYNRAISLLKRLLEVDKADPEANERLVKILLKKGDMDEAYRRYRLYEAFSLTELGARPSKLFDQLREEVSVN